VDLELLEGVEQMGLQGTFGDEQPLGDLARRRCPADMSWSVI
jgi:hypothetical protein